MHLVSLAVSARLRGRGEPPAQAWELMRQCGEVSSSRSWQAGLRFKPQPCVRRSARLIRAATMAGSHGVIVPSTASRSRQVRTVRSDSPV